MLVESQQERGARHPFAGEHRRNIHPSHAEALTHRPDGLPTRVEDDTPAVVRRVDRLAVDFDGIFELNRVGNEPNLVQGHSLGILEPPRGNPVGAVTDEEIVAVCRHALGVPDRDFRGRRAIRGRSQLVGRGEMLQEPKAVLHRGSTEVFNVQEIQTARACGLHDIDVAHHIGCQRLGQHQTVAVSADFARDELRGSALHPQR